MRFIESALSGAWLVVPEPIEDERGSFARVFCSKEFADHGLEPLFVQHSISHSRLKGTLRGMHYQQSPDGETKLVSCQRGAIFDVIVDLRPKSQTFRRWVSYELSARNRYQLLVPKGFAHGFMTLCDDVVVHYLISEFHKPEASRGLRYDDPALGINWPDAPSVLSERDKSWPLIQPNAFDPLETVRADRVS